MSSQQPSRHPTPPPMHRRSPPRPSAGPARHTSLRPAQLVRVSAATPTTLPAPARPRGAADPQLYAWDALATIQRRAVLGLLDANRRQGRRARRRAALLTLLLVLLFVALLGVVAFGLALPLTRPF